MLLDTVLGLGLGLGFISLTPPSLGYAGSPTEVVTTGKSLRYM